MSDLEIVFRLSEEEAAATNTGRFMATHAIPTYRELHRRSIADPEWFWEAYVEFTGMPFIKPWRTTRDTSRGHPWATWFVGGQFNLSQACVDRWADDDPTRQAVRTLKETGDRRDLNFGELRNEVGKLAGALRSLGVKRGDMFVSQAVNEECGR